MAEQDLDDAHVRALWRKVCTVTCLLKPAAAQAERQAASETQENSNAQPACKIEYLLRSNHGDGSIAYEFFTWSNRGQSYLPGDLVAGITLAAYAIPVSLAYATLANMPLQTGV